MPEAKPYVISKQVVWEAYQKVKANHGAAGVDGQSIEAFADDRQVSLSMDTLSNPDRKVALFAEGGVMRCRCLKPTHWNRSGTAPGTSLSFAVDGFSAR